MKEMLPTLKDGAISAVVFMVTVTLVHLLGSLYPMVFGGTGQTLIMGAFGAISWLVMASRMRGQRALSERRRKEELERAVEMVEAGEPLPAPEPMDTRSVMDLLAKRPWQTLRMIMAFVMLLNLAFILSSAGFAGAIGFALLGALIFAATSFMQLSSWHREEQNRRKRTLLTYLAVHLGGEEAVEGVELTWTDRVRSALTRSSSMLAFLAIVSAAAPFFIGRLAEFSVTPGHVGASALVGALVAIGLIAKDVVLDFEDNESNERAERAYTEALANHADLIGALTDGSHAGGGLSLESRAAGSVALADAGATVLDFGDEAADEHAEEQEQSVTS